MTSTRRRWWRAVPLVFLAYVTLALLSLRLLGRGVPQSAEPLISIVALPIMYVFQPTYPLLDRMGLMEGDWWRLPSYRGFAVAATIYAGLLWALTRWTDRRD